MWDLQNEVVKDLLTSGMIQWRAKLAHPPKSFRQAAADSEEYLSTLAMLGPTREGWKHFHFELVDYVRVLLGDEVDTDHLRNCLGTILPNEHELKNLFLADRFLDMAVLLRMLTGETWLLWDTVLARHATKKRRRLLVATYSGYWNLIGLL